jgi:hypothetical protein
MASKISAETALASAANIEKVWQANPDMSFGKEGDPDNPKVTLADYQSAKTKVEGLMDQIETLRHQLTQLVDDKDDAAVKLSGMNTRALSMVRGVFGPDSAEYDQAGAVRTSERKKAVRSKTTAPTT